MPLCGGPGRLAEAEAGGEAVRLVGDARGVPQGTGVISLHLLKERSEGSSRVVKAYHRLSLPCPLCRREELDRIAVAHLERAAAATEVESPQEPEDSNLPQHVLALFGGAVSTPRNLPPQITTTQTDRHKPAMVAHCQL